MKKTFLPLLIGGVLFSVTGCYREGCMNPDADNYDEKANSSDFSCTYSSTVFFWADPVTSDSLLNIEGHQILRFELEGEIVDSVATQAFVSLEGVCGTTGVMTIDRTFTGNNEWNYKYRVKGNGFATLYEGFILLRAGLCEEVKLE